MFDCAIIGDGIVGLATIMKLRQKNPIGRINVFEKEEGFAQSHSQNGRFSSAHPWLVLTVR